MLTREREREREKGKFNLNNFLLLYKFLSSIASGRENKLQKGDRKRSFTAHYLQI